VLELEFAKLILVQLIYDRTHLFHKKCCLNGINEHYF